MPEHEMFAEQDGPGQRALFGVLKCVALTFPDAGYVQGMNYMVSILMTLVAADEALAITISMCSDVKY
jgi:predicted phosphohydrolase